MDKMKIGIIVYSQTGNTFEVAQRLQSALVERGQDAELTRLQVVGEAKPGVKDFQFESLPDTERYDAVIFGAPVHAFSLAPMMNSYLRQAEGLHGKRISLFVTQHFPYTWMGGGRAVGQMRGLCESKGALVGATGVVNWSNKARQQQIEKAIREISEYFTGA